MGMSSPATIKKDTTTGYSSAISPEEKAINEGRHFFVCGVTTLNDTDTIDFQLTTPNTTEWVHMEFQIEGTQQITVEIYEGATVTADGTAITAYNNNRNSTNATSLTMLQYDGAVADNGTRIFINTFGVAGNVNQAKEGAVSREKKLILDQNSTYRFLITSGGNGNVISYCGEWEEATNI